MIQTKRSRLVSAILVVLMSLPATAEDLVDEIVVTADLRGRTIDQIPASVSLLDAESIEQLATQHFEELVNVIPNLNWSGDGHRARYFQIRGVGELEQYQGAPNPSIGFLIDDIDFSGIGTIATLFDVERVEVLRGPQGSRYGANALGGLIYMQSAMPTTERDARITLTAADDDAWSAGIALGGPIGTGEQFLFRLSGHHHESNGFRNNSYLGRNDTNGRQESVLRGRLTVQPGDKIDINLALLASSVDNGYDAFSLDNGYTMLSDKPGRDAQDSIGASLKIEWRGFERASLTSITAFADSDIDFSFDADWGNDNSWAPVTYDYISISERKRRTLSQEFRLVSTPGTNSGWIAGLYAMRLDDDLVTVNQGDYYDPFYDFADSLDDTFGSGYEATSVAGFGQFEVGLQSATRFTASLRLERRISDYVDTGGLSTGPSESMAGGDLSISHDHSEALTSFVSLSRGYKAGGFNIGPVPSGGREFGQETAWNLEAGIKSSLLSNTLSLNASVFYTRRDDQQVRQSTQLVPGDPTTFVFYTGNAAEGETLGFEADVKWRPTDDWEFYASVGLLDATFKNYVSGGVDLSGRAQAHAPDYTLAIGAAYRHPSGWFARIDASAKDAFYFDVSHNEMSRAYELVNARVGFDADRFSVHVWGRNLYDKAYAVRGFFFGNEPPDFLPTKYVRLGDARQVGVTINVRYR